MGTAALTGAALMGARLGLARQDGVATPTDATPVDATPVDATPESGAESVPDADTTVFDVEAVDVSFNPDEFTIPADTDVTIEFVNTGAMQHDWVVEETDVASSLLSRGQGETLTVNLPAGEYTYICSVPGHAPAGMVGTLIVE